MRLLILLLPISLLAFPRTKNNEDGMSGSLSGKHYNLEARKTRIAEIKKRNQTVHRMGTTEILSNTVQISENLHDAAGIVAPDSSPVLPLHLFDGDMLLTERQRSLLKNDSRRKRQVSGFTNKWTGNTLYYYFDASINARKKASVQAALKYIRDHTCIDFVESSTAVNRVKVMSGSGCSSQVGMEGGEQLMSLGNGCESIGSVAHEFLHALGFIHTHQREDRDDYINVDLTKVSPSLHSAFLRNTPGFGTNYVPYEYGSVMHYGTTAFANTSGALTILAKDQRYMYTMGGNQVSPYDLKALNDFYQCYDRCPINNQLKNGATVNPRTCGANCPDGYGGALCDQQPAGCGETLAASGNWQRKTFSFGNANDLATKDGFTWCSYWITSPKNTQIEVKLLDMTAAQCRYGCQFHGIEFKVDKDPMLTNPRYCCTSDVDKVFQSELNPMPINLYNRYGGNTYTIEFRYIDVTPSTSCTKKPPVITTVPTVPTTTSTTTTSTTTPTTTTIEFDPNIVSYSLVPLQRMYNTLDWESYASNYYSDEILIAKLEDEGYGIDVDIGRIVDLDTFDMNSDRLLAACPELVKLRALIHPILNTQFMTTSDSEAQDHIDEGWSEIRSVGYCVSSPKCGATRKLGYLTAHDYSDVYYSTDENELKQMNTVQMYAGTLTSPVCWLFEDEDYE